MTRGMGVKIPVGGLRISLNSEIETRLELHVMFDVCPTWLDIAFRRVLEAGTGRTRASPITSSFSGRERTC